MGGRQNLDKPLPRYRRAEVDEEVEENVKKMADKLLAKEKSANKIGRPDFREDFNQLWEILKEEVDDKLTNPRMSAYLAAYSIVGSVSYASKCAGISPATIYSWEKDDLFMEYYKRAEKAHTEYMELEAQRRAVMGTTEDVYYQGEKVGTKKKYSDSLLKFLLKGKKPKVYGNTSKVEIKGDKNSKIQVNFGIPDMNQEIDTSEVE